MCIETALNSDECWKWNLERILLIKLNWQCVFVQLYKVLMENWIKHLQSKFNRDIVMNLGTFISNFSHITTTNDNMKSRKLLMQIVNTLEA